MHDRAVLAEARQLKRNGWDVKVDHVEGNEWETPPVLNDRQPDIYATEENRGTKRAVEIETDKADDKDQRRDLREWASQEKSRDFYWRVVDDNGSRGKKRD